MLNIQTQIESALVLLVLKITTDTLQGSSSRCKKTKKAPSSGI